MRLKTRYREIKSENKSAENELSPVEAAIIAEPEAPVVAAATREAPEAKPEAITPPEDEASLALRKQIEALRQSELRHRQAAMMAAQQVPVTREQKMALWKSKGMNEAEEKFLTDHPEGIDYPQLVAMAAHDAMASGIERDSPEYWQTVESNFEQHMQHLKQAQAQAPAAKPVAPTPAFFAVPPAPAPAAPSQARIVSAPVSREIPSASRERPQNPNQVKLSPDEIEIARASGISLLDYAKGKLELERQKAAGIRQ